jgi:hypothetical protein
MRYEETLAGISVWPQPRVSGAMTGTRRDQGRNHVPPYLVRIRETAHKQHVLALAGHDDVHVDAIHAHFLFLVLHATAHAMNRHLSP